MIPQPPSAPTPQGDASDASVAISFPASPSSSNSIHGMGASSAKTGSANPLTAGGQAPRKVTERK